MVIYSIKKSQTGQKSQNGGCQNSPYSAFFYWWIFPPVLFPWQQVSRVPAAASSRQSPSRCGCSGGGSARGDLNRTTAVQSESEMSRRHRWARRRGCACFWRQARPGRRNVESMAWMYYIILPWKSLSLSLYIYIYLPLSHFLHLFASFEVKQTVVVTIVIVVVTLVQ